MKIIVIHINPQVIHIVIHKLSTTVQKLST